jgi:preprotein translocase subunit SecG
VEVLKYILIVLYAIACVALTIIAMVQSKDDNGASATITGSSSNFYEKNKGRTKEGKMKKWTIILAVAYAVLAIGLSIVYVM